MPATEVFIIIAVICFALLILLMVVCEFLLMRKSKVNTDLILNNMKRISDLESNLYTVDRDLQTSKMEFREKYVQGGIKYNNYSDDMK